jgi:hypothetical protein
MEQKKRCNPHNGSSIHEKLYQESYHLQSKRNQLHNSSDHNLITSVSSSRPGDVPFLERMAISINERQQRQHIAASVEEETIDSSTGQPFFKPQINKGSMVQRNTEQLPIGDYLYQQRQTKEIR